MMTDIYPIHYQMSRACYDSLQKIASGDMSQRFSGVCGLVACRVQAVVVVVFSACQQTFLLPYSMYKLFSRILLLNGCSFDACQRAVIALALLVGLTAARVFVSLAAALSPELVFSVARADQMLHIGTLFYYLQFVAFVSGGGRQLFQLPQMSWIDRLKMAINCHGVIQSRLQLEPHNSNAVFNERDAVMIEELERFVRGFLHRQPFSVVELVQELYRSSHRPLSRQIFDSWLIHYMKDAVEQVCEKHIYTRDNIESCDGEALYGVLNYAIARTIDTTLLVVDQNDRKQLIMLEREGDGGLEVRDGSFLFAYHNELLELKKYLALLSDEEKAAFFLRVASVEKGELPRTAHIAFIQAFRSREVERNLGVFSRELRNLFGNDEESSAEDRRPSSIVLE